MIIQNLELKNFKNLNGRFELSPAINIVYGRNGLGKTNFIESIFYLGRAYSFRHTNERGLINWDTKEYFTKVAVEFENTKDKSKNKLEYIISDDIGILRKKLLVDGVKKPKADFSFRLPLILFLPQHVDIISGSPEMRRREIDDFISMVSPEFKKTDLEFRKILRNRNKLLKMIQKKEASQSELEYWDMGLIETGSKIIFNRTKVLDELVPKVSKLAEELFDEQLKELEYKYISKVYDKKYNTLKEIQDSFEKKINTGRYKELGAGMTLYGPQRDDINFSSNGIDIHEFGSRGQQRIVSLIFKLAMWYFYKEKFKVSPILLLDDVMSELDAGHGANLEEILKSLKTQIIVSSASEYDYSDMIMKDSNRIDF